MIMAKIENPSAVNLFQSVVDDCGYQPASSRPAIGERTLVKRPHNWPVSVHGTKAPVLFACIVLRGLKAGKQGQCTA